MKNFKRNLNFVSSIIGNIESSNLRKPVSV